MNDQPDNRPSPDSTTAMLIAIPGLLFLGFVVVTVIFGGDAVMDVVNAVFGWIDNLFDRARDF
jgi:hypothetical protein